MPLVSTQDYNRLTMNKDLIGNYFRHPTCLCWLGGPRFRVLFFGCVSYLPLQLGWAKIWGCHPFSLDFLQCHSFAQSCFSSYRKVMTSDALVIWFISKISKSHVYNQRFQKCFWLVHKPTQHWLVVFNWLWELSCNVRLRKAETTQIPVWGP